MNIRIKGIGIINDSTIDLNGLTIITGKNNSGKTTLGKILYSYIESISDIQNNALRDTNFYIFKKIYNVVDILQFFITFTRACKTEEVIKFLENNTYLKMFSEQKSFVYKQDEDYSNMAQALIQELKNLLDNNSYILDIANSFYNKIQIDSNEPLDVKKLLETTTNNCIMVLTQTFDLLDKNKSLQPYTQERISQLFNMEFSEQIQPVLHDTDNSFIEIHDDTYPNVILKFKNNTLEKEKDPIIYQSSYKKIFMIDDPFIIDEANISFKNNRGSLIDSLVDTSTLMNHEEKLKKFLKLKINQNPYESSVIDENYKLIKSKIDDVIPGSFEFSDDGDFYIQNGRKLKTSNLATGSKLFAIMKILLSKGCIDDSTILIFDEPEAHLHPDWQNIFAEIIVLLVKELNVKVVLTTHSPNFVLALEANMRKHKIENKTNFYHTNFHEDGLVDYTCVDDNIEVIYADFLEALSASKIIREKFLNNQD